MTYEWLPDLMNKREKQILVDDGLHTMQHGIDYEQSDTCVAITKEMDTPLDNLLGKSVIANK